MKCTDMDVSFHKLRYIGNSNIGQEKKKEN